MMELNETESTYPFHNRMSIEQYCIISLFRNSGSFHDHERQGRLGKQRVEEWDLWLYGLSDTEIGKGSSSIEFRRLRTWVTNQLRRDEKQEVISISASHGLAVDVGRLPIIRPSGQRAIVQERARSEK